MTTAVDYVRFSLPFLALGAYTAAAWFIPYNRRKLANANSAALNAAIQTVLSNRQYPYMFQSGLSVMALDADGARLRFVHFTPGSTVRGGAPPGVQTDVTVQVEQIQQFDMNRRQKVSLDTVTRSQREGAGGRMLAGGLMFGGLGALAGVEASPLTSQSSVSQNVTYYYSELIFVVNDLANPMIRFQSADDGLIEQWYLRIKNAIARHGSAAAQANCTLDQRLVGGPA